MMDGFMITKRGVDEGLAEKLVFFVILLNVY